MHHGLYSEQHVPYNIRNVMPVNQPRTNTVTYGLHLLRYQGAKLWNSLPNEIKYVLDRKQFKSFTYT